MSMPRGAARGPRCTLIYFPQAIAPFEHRDEEGRVSVLPSSCRDRGPAADTGFEAAPGIVLLLFCLLTSIVAHTQAGGMAPGPGGLLVTDLALGPLALAVNRFAHGPVALLFAGVLGQLTAHVALSIVTPAHHAAPMTRRRRTSTVPTQPPPGSGHNGQRHAVVVQRRSSRTHHRYGCRNGVRPPSCGARHCVARHRRSPGTTPRRRHGSRRYPAHHRSRDTAVRTCSARHTRGDSEGALPRRLAR